MAIPAANARTIAARRQALAVLADSPDGCTRDEMSRRGFGPAVLNDLLLKRLAIAHMATEVRGSMLAASAPNSERAPFARSRIFRVCR